MSCKRCVGATKHAVSPSRFLSYPCHVHGFQWKISVSIRCIFRHLVLRISMNTYSYLFQTILNLFRFKISSFFFFIYYRSKIHELEWFRDCVTAPSDRWIFDRRLTEIRLIEALCSRHGSLSMLSFPDRSFKYTYPSCFDSQKNDCINGDWIWKREQSFQTASKCLISNFARLFSINELIEI